MAENLQIPSTKNKKETYKVLVPQVDSLLKGEEDLIANLANFVAVLKEAFDFFWVGFYIKKENELVLGPFQGPIACTRISFDRGVCGACYTQQQTIVVDDVNKYPGHIACSIHSKSEIVIPIFKDGEVVFVLDIDSDKLADFTNEDKEGLESLANVLELYI